MKKRFYITVWIFLFIPYYISALNLTSDSHNLDCTGDFDNCIISNEKHGEELFNKIRINDYGTTAEIGKPELPIFTQLVSLPNTETYVLSRFKYDFDEQELEHPLQYFGWEDNMPRDEDFYKSDEWYPKEIVKISSPVIMRGYRFCQIAIAAVQYNPAKNTIRILKDIDAEFTLDYSDNENPIVSTKSRQSSSFSKIASEQIYGIRKSDIKETGSYLIITPDECMSILETLAAWKRKLGHEVVLTPLSEIGTDPTENMIKQYIQYAYDHWDIPPEYVLLVGDVTGNFVIPAYYVEGYATQWDVTDHTYTLLEGNDYYPDVFIGRFPIQSLMECATAVSKIINYEGSLCAGDWYNRALMISGIIDDYYFSSYITKMNVRDKLLEFGYNEVDTFIYPYNTGTQQLLNLIDSGYSLINFRGFGYYWYWSNGELILQSDDISYLNNGCMLPMITSMTCGGGNFAAEGIHRCFGEAWLFAGTSSISKGAIGFIGPSEHDTKTPWNNCNDMGIYQGITNEDIYRCGEMLLRGKMELYNNYPHNHGWGGSEDSDQFYFYVYGLIGDPGLKVWTSSPDSIFLLCSDSITCNQNYVDIEVAVNDDISGFMVALTKDDSLITKGFTDVNGNIIFNRNFILGTYEITASKYGYLPETHELTVYSNESLELTEVTFIDEPISGNTCEYEFHIFNPTSYNAEEVSALINSIDEEINIITDSIYIDNIQSQGNYTCQNLFFSINEKWLGETESNISVHVNSTLGNQSYMIPVEIGSPELVVSQCVVQNNDCCLIQGQEDNVFIELTNTGTWETGLFYVLLTCTNDKVTVTENESYYTTISADGNGVNALPFSVLPHQILTGESALFEMQIFKDDSLVQNLQFSLPVGIISEASPTFSQYGYYAIESSDVGNFDAPIYDWVEVDPTLGGEGTLLSGSYTTSDGYITFVELPFEVIYFGHFCDKMTVCSEGWISMCEELVYHRNKTIPSGCGPAAMIAPFWDDLRDGNIFTWFNENEHKFIIEWQDFLNVYDPTQKETFEVILYDPAYYPTSNGNVEILYQYKSISNVDQSDNYATVGIENFSQTDGVLITYSDINAPTAHQLQNETAILFTIHESPDIPLLEVQPVSLTYSLPQDTTISDNILLTNTSTTELSYSISTSHCTSKEQASGGRNIENDFIIASTMLYQSIIPMDIYCYLYHTSPDAEPIYGVKMDFPDGVYVNDATTIRTLTYNGQTGNGVEAHWGYGQGLPLHIQGIHSFGINVTISDTVTGPITIDWYIEGDGSGDPPHYTEGSITLEPSTAKHLQIEYPNGGETWVYNTVDTIRWLTSGNIDEVSLYFNTEINGDWELIAENIPNTNEYSYAIVGDLSNFCKINIRDPNGYAGDTSNDFFSINIFDITHPGDGDELRYNTSDTLRWNYTGIYDDVILEISRDGGNNWSLVNEAVPNIGEYEYLVQGPPSDWCVYKMSSPDQSISNCSHGNFRIIDPEVSWIELDTHSGNLSGGETKNLNFEVSTIGIEAGSYYAYITIRSNIGQKILIPLTLEVTCSTTNPEYSVSRLISFPNPFTNSTTLQFSKTTRLLSDTPRQAEHTETTEINIYNVKGQLIRKLGFRDLDVGFSAEWDGKDTNGNDIKSGVYFYKLSDDDEYIGKVVKLR